MGSVGAPEVLVILVLALLVLGPERLPQAARTMGRWVAEFRRITGSLQAEARDVVDEVMRPINETATMATEAFTSTYSTTDEASVGPIEPVGTTTDATPAEVSGEPVAIDADAGNEPGSRLAADVPLPAASRLPEPPLDPSLN